MTRVLLVGEQNPYSRHPEDALYPFPENASGDRLRRILSMTVDEYLEAFDRTNLLGRGRWSIKRARASAAALTHARRVLLGRRVAEAHGVPFEPFTFRGDLLVLPHPSGRCRVWNDARNAGRARNLVRELQGRSAWAQT